ncbi:urease accessory protein UreF [Roseibium denhamense]|uniref:Urease accessory protein UreF n=1 Tax=Roseibium denhamense TaxID=76305 RepID=A0ABY1PBF1_9HYPH|nr:urease accessory protein UreF [Roseibium denhamense]MTI05296.1 urease accessory protein UreF [Roseibium denhamense]SMP30488.1 urease accessory protein [Roseibium denhamense]
MTQPISQSALYRLMTFLSPAFPVGAFTYSHGLEQAIEAGDVTDILSFTDWLQDVLQFGAGRTDAILLKETHAACHIGDVKRIEELQTLGLAMQPSKERYLETSAQGTAFINAVAQSWAPADGKTAGRTFLDMTAKSSGPWPYPVAAGLTCAAHGIPVLPATTAFLHAFAANIVSAAVRAVPFGQNQGQGVLAELEPLVFQIADRAQTCGLDDLGTSTFLADIASMAHETQYSRLFRS